MAKSKKKARSHGGWEDRLADIAIRGLIWVALRFPVKTRMNMIGWLVSRLVGPLAGWNKRIGSNLDYVWPDLPEADRSRIIDEVLDNIGRAFIENYDVPELMARAAKYSASGPGLAHIERAQAEGRPVLLVSGHYGSGECARCALVTRGYKVGGLIRPMSNPYFNAHYVQNMRDICEPAFEQGRRGTMGLIKYVKQGGMAILLFDVYDSAGEPIDFLGKPAPTLTSTAEIALRTNALMVPYFGIRHADRYGFEAVFQEPIEHTTPIEMMQEATRRLEEQIHKDPGQWLWLHRRWKPDRQKRLQRKRAAATMAP